jgi:hypothetical protein
MEIDGRCQRCTSRVYLRVTPAGVVVIVLLLLGAVIAAVPWRLKAALRSNFLVSGLPVLKLKLRIIVAFFQVHSAVAVAATVSRSRPR